MKMVRLALAALLMVFVLASTPRAFAQPLVPLADAVEEPLIPTGISRDTVELSGRYAYLWSQPDGVHVIQYHGHFELVTGARRLHSENAVIWWNRATWEGQPYYHYEVYLWRDARLIEAAGTTTSGPALFVTFNSYELPEVRDDAATGESSADTDLYREALKVRETVAQLSPVPTYPGQMRVLSLADEAEPIPTKARPVVQYHGDEQDYDPAEGVATAIGHVYVSQGTIDSGDFLEIRADAAVIFMTPEQPAESQDASGLSDDRSLTPSEASPTAGTLQGTATVDLGDQFGNAVAGAYLEGNVVLTMGERMIRAPQLYYDFEHDRALILDAVMRGIVPERDLPVYVRAKQIRQLSATEFVARKAMITTSEFHTPHVHIGADRVVLTDRTPRDETGQITGVFAGKYRASHTTMNVGGVPILYWPYSQGDFRQTENALRSARFAFSDDFGVTAQAKWYLFNLLGLETPEGVDASLRTDYFSERGPAVGIDLDYQRDDHYGLLRGYYIHDTGTDNLGGFRNDLEPDTQDRGRLTWRHRHFLPKDWELTLEMSYLSDPAFLEEYFESEFDEDKEQESLVYLKKQRDNWAFTLLGQWRLMDFVTQTEHLPDAAFHLIGEPLGGFASVFSESHMGWARYRPDNRRLFEHGRMDGTGPSDITFRGITRNEIDAPLALGPVKVVPYATGRYGKWDGSPFEGSLTQAFGSVGVRATSRIWRLFEDVQSRLLDVNGVRHIITPELTAWASTANKDSFDLHPFDESIEGADDFSGASLAVRQRWQTKRGGPGRWRVVDWIMLRLEVAAFDNAPENDLPIGRFYWSRPENSIARNHARGDFVYRISDTTAVFSDANWDLTDGHMALFNLSLAVERTPRYGYFIGYRRIHETNSNLLGFGANYQINSKHSIAFREYFDLDRGKTETFDITIIRRFPRWYAALTIDASEVEDTLSVSLSVWPEGLPEAAIGSRRYTGLATSTGINAQSE
ncbi:MAG: hypothetical protein JXA69_19280 [Phycisphaerae bacterium]|nr:hypothetical protein [Phycisphaerae bacterium]